MLVAYRTAVLMPMMFFLAGIPLRAQAAASSAEVVQERAETPAVSYAFDVASIRPNNSDSRNFGGGFNASGYRVTNFPLAEIVFDAYLPEFKGHQLIGMPAWAVNERYDIVAHIDEATAASWLKLNGRQRGIAGRSMLQKLLAERCGLVAHLVPAQADGYALVVSKRGSRLQPGLARESYPEGVKNLDPEGGKVFSARPSNDNTMSFFNARLQDMADIVGMTSDSVIQDQTGLSGRFDFTIRRLEDRDVDGKRISDPQPTDVWDISTTGLELKRVKLPSQNLVIDHIERPSPN